MQANCIFCMIAKGEVASEKVFENDHVMVIKDTSPRTKGHSLVIPKEHFVTFADIPKEYFIDFLTATQEAVQRLAQETGMEGYNLIMNNHAIAGQVIPHAHLHIIPRHAKDGVDVIK